MRWSAGQLGERIDEVLVDAYGEHEQLGAFACAFDELLDKPVPATVIGEAVELVSVHDGGQFLGLRAMCRRLGRTWEVAFLDVVLDQPVDGDLDLTTQAYRRWAHAVS